MEEKNTAPNPVPAKETAKYGPMSQIMVSVTEKGLQVSLKTLPSSLHFHAERGQNDR